MTPEKPRRLGRGLEALLTPSAAAQAITPNEQSALQQIAIAQIRPNPFQPRKDFRSDELADLEASIRTSGLLQPITVRPAPKGGGYELIAGERRLRAATQLGWAEIPAVVKPTDDRTLLTLALVENLQRADLNPVEEAEGYQRLLDEFELTQQEVADVVGKDRSTVANTLRILGLPASVRRMLQDGEMTLGHARALLTIGNDHLMTELAREVVAQGLSVREVERRAREAAPQKRKPPRDAAKADASASAEARRIEDRLRRYLQTDVHVALATKERGEIKIHFYSADDMDRILELVTGSASETP